MPPGYDWINLVVLLAALLGGAHYINRWFEQNYVLSLARLRRERRTLHMEAQMAQNSAASWQVAHDQLRSRCRAAEARIAQYQAAGVTPVQVNEQLEAAQQEVIMLRQALEVCRKSMIAMQSHTGVIPPEQIYVTDNKNRIIGTTVLN
jgi:predicted kinase